MAYQLGTRLTVNPYDLIHVGHLKRGQHSYVDEFYSFNTRATNGKNLVVVKTARTPAENHILQLEEETLRVIAESCAARNEVQPVAKLLGSFNYNGKQSLVVEAGWMSLQDLLQSKESPNEEECLELSRKIINTVDQVHMCGYLHCNISPSNVIFRFPTELHRDIEVYHIVEQAIETATGTRRLALQTLLTQLPLQVPYHPFVYNQPWNELDFVLANASNAKPLGGGPVQRHVEYTGDECNYLSPEALLRGYNTPSSDIYSSSLVAARICMGEPLVQLVGDLKEDITTNCIKQLISLKGYIRYPVLLTYLDRNVYFNADCMLSRAAHPELRKSSLKRLLRETLIERAGWSAENMNKVYTLLASAMKHNASMRGNAHNLLTMLENDP